MMMAFIGKYYQKVTVPSAHNNRHHTGTVINPSVRGGFIIQTKYQNST